MKNRKLIVVFLVLFCIIGLIAVTMVLNNRDANTSTNNIEKTKQISYYSQNKNLSMDIPTNWSYELNEKQDETLNYEVKIYPNEEDKEKYFILNTDSSFGVCGTGLETKSIQLDNGNTAYIGYYYDENNSWQFISFKENEKMYAWNFNLNEEDARAAIECIKTLQIN